jgi:hypothetical protein
MPSLETLVILSEAKDLCSFAGIGTVHRSFVAKNATQDDINYSFILGR